MFLPILCVDDNPDTLAALRRLLEEEEYSAVTFEKPGEALTWLKDNSPSVVLAELALPDFDGLELLEYAQKLRPAAQRVLLTSSNDFELFQTAFNSGTIQYALRKPWVGDELLAVIDAAVARSVQDDKQGAMAELLKKQNLELETMTRQLETMVDRRTRQIERAKKQWEKTFDAISDPLTLVNSRLELQRANLAASLHAGVPVRSIPGSRCYETLFGREEPCRGCPLGNLSEGSTDSLDSSKAEVKDERGGKTFLLSLFLLDRDPTNRKFICYYKDITEEKKLQNQVLQSEKMAGIGQLAGGVAHELNNPIGVILAFTQLSKTTASEIKDEELLDNLQEIENAATRCKKIVASLLDFSRPSMDQRMWPVNLNEVLEKALFLVSTQSATRDLEIEKNLSSTSTLVQGNENQLLQVFINLVRNAVQAMPEGGTLTIDTIVAQDGRVAAAVSDTGVGISAEALNRLFEPFYTTKDPGKGTGLGLSVTYGIVEGHDGTIDVSSVPGEGSRFVVTLPPAPTGSE